MGEDVEDVAEIGGEEEEDVHRVGDSMGPGDVMNSTGHKGGASRHERPLRAGNIAMGIVLRV